MKRDKRLGIPAAVGAATAFYVLSFLLWPLPDAAQRGCEVDATSITMIQGNGSVTPLDGERVLTRGVVTADFTDEKELGGFFLQQGSDTASDSEAASRGLFVYAPGMDVEPGDRLLLNGEAGEYHGMTQLSNVRLQARCGQGQEIPPVTVSLPLNDEERHRLQGMKLRLEPPLAVTGLYELGRYGVVTVADDRLYRPTQVHEPGLAARQQAARNRDRMLRIDDGSRQQAPPLPDWVSTAFQSRQSLRVGDSLSTVEGILDYRYGHWRLQPLEAPSVRVANARPDPMERPPEGVIRVASFNLQNYFNGDGDGGGFPTERGAADPEAFERQHRRLVSALSGLSADIIGVIEVANDGYGPGSALAELTSALGTDWHYVRPDVERLGSDAIAVGLLYRQGRIQPEGAPRSLHSGAFVRLNRPPLAQRFRHRGTGETVWVMVNHFKSKHCKGATAANRAQGDGQACWNPVRVRAADRLVDWSQELADESDEADFLLLGDLNAYAREDPVRRLERAGFRNVLKGQHGSMPASGYVYRAQSGTLDYILSTSTLKPLIRDAGIWPINADEPPILYYDKERRHDIPEVVVSGDGPWRSSDHDPTWVDLEFGALGDD